MQNEKHYYTPPYHRPGEIPTHWKIGLNHTHRDMKKKFEKYWAENNRIWNLTHINQEISHLH